MTKIVDKNLAIILARGNSKSVTKKNLRKVAGHSLVWHAINSALKCKEINYIVLSSDSEEILEEGKKLGICIHLRSLLNSSDTASSENAMIEVIHDLNLQKYDKTILLQPTSPLRKSYHISEALKLFQERKANSLISVCALAHHPLKSFYFKSDSTVEPLIDQKHPFMPRQELPEVVRPNGAIYIIRTDMFYESKSLFVQPCIGYLMDAKSSIDVDTFNDLKIARKHFDK